MIELQEATKLYGDRAALSGVSFRLEGPGIVGLLGPNGSGKTTTLRLMAGFFPPTRGAVLFEGRPAVESAPARVGYLPEQAPLYDEMTVAAYLVFVARIKGLRGAAARAAVDAVIEKLSLGARRDQLIGTLSRGFRQRVGIAQALVHRPSTLLLDEPTAGLDPQQIEEARAVIRDAAREATVVMSTHLLAEVETLCRRVVVLREGELAGELAVSASTAGRWRLVVSGDLPGKRAQLLERARVQVAGEHAREADGVWALELTAPEPEAIAAAVVGLGLGLRTLEPARVDLFREYARLQARS